MLRKLADFKQSRENVKFFGVRSAEANGGTCYAYVIQWLRAVGEIGGTSTNEAAKRMAILRAGWHDIRLLDRKYKEGGYSNSLSSDADDFTGLCQSVGRTVMAADPARPPTLTNGTAIAQIPAQVTDREFQNFFANLVVAGLKSMTYQYAGGRHALGVKGFGDRILYFDPNDGEFEMDRDGFFSALQQHGNASGDDQLYNAWFVTLL